MSDVFAVDLALDFSPTVPSAVLDSVRWHLGGRATRDETDVVDDMPDFVPLLSGRGPAVRVGGVLTGELFQGADHWSLTARQEIHAELLPELDSLVQMLAYNARTEGVIGQMRFHEEDVPELLINRSGTLVRVPLRAADPTVS
ncbi:hypothetical protein [Streptomyces sp. AC555_RSS877]|uniref:hypothetical protein n=1 Tax=Streptomyces sp. AC555_RSS877 TaxID=2823688 RepID=UPI001C277487|nr:hypothetical protein [Streptomyces sp. AC555_RSS877]